MKMEFFKDRIFTLTPLGKIIELPKDATVVETTETTEETVPKSMDIEVNETELNMSKDAIDDVESDIDQLLSDFQ